jgi:hypothetical protein
MMLHFVKSDNFEELCMKMHPAIWNISDFGEAMLRESGKSPRLRREASSIDTKEFDLRDMCTKIKW